MDDLNLNVLKNIVRTGWVSSVNVEERTARVIFEDKGETIVATVASLESRVARVEDGIFNNITGNPYLVSFDSLDGIVLTKGIWNADRKRIEC